MTSAVEHCACLVRLFVAELRHFAGLAMPLASFFNVFVCLTLLRCIIMVYIKTRYIKFSHANL